MKKGLIGLLVVILIFVFCGLQLWNHRLAIINLEEQVKARHVANKSNYDNMWKRFVEMTQVTDKQAEHFKDIYTGLISGRYQDQNLLFKAVQEQNPQINGAIYEKLQNEIAAGRREFDNNQAKITDIIREYNMAITRYPITAIVTSKAKLDANAFIVTSQKTQDAFNSGKDEPVNINGK